MKQADRIHLPLQIGDTEKQTVGCRYGNPDICYKHSLPSVCAFVRADGICLDPPKSWPKHYRKLQGAAP